MHDNRSQTDIPQYDMPLQEDIDRAVRMVQLSERLREEREGLGAMRIVGVAVMLIMGVAAASTLYAIIRFIQWVMP